ncbi:hypothetical protein ACRJ4W_35735 [Streptomyces sp. GLT-R25]
MPLTTFVGRLREVGEIGASLEQARLVTLTGAGGAGKSRLALEVATQRTARHQDGGMAGRAGRALRPRSRRAHRRRCP